MIVSSKLLLANVWALGLIATLVTHEECLVRVRRQRGVAPEAVGILAAVGAAWGRDGGVDGGLA